MLRRVDLFPSQTAQGIHQPFESGLFFWRSVGPSTSRLPPVLVWDR